MSQVKNFISELMAMTPREINTFSLCLLRNGIPQSLRIIMIDMIFRSSKLKFIDRVQHIHGGITVDHYDITGLLEKGPTKSDTTLTRLELPEIFGNIYNIWEVYINMETENEMEYIYSQEPRINIICHHGKISVFLRPECMPNIEYQGHYYSNIDYPHLKELIDSKDEKNIDKYIRATDSQLIIAKEQRDGTILESLSRLFLDVSDNTTFRRAFF